GDLLWSVEPVVLRRHVWPLRVAGFMEAFAKRGHVARVGIGRPGSDKPDRRQRRLLRARRERPRRRAAEQGDELAALYTHSITSSARVMRVGGTSRPSALAVLRVMTSSHLVGAGTGD